VSGQTPQEQPLTNGAVWKELGKLWVQAWFCIRRDHRHVEWHGDIACCAEPGCGITSEDTRPWLQDMAEAITRAETERDAAHAEVERLRADHARAIDAATSVQDDDGPILRDAARLLPLATAAHGSVTDGSQAAAALSLAGTLASRVPGIIRDLRVNRAVIAALLIEGEQLRSELARVRDVPLGRRHPDGSLSVEWATRVLAARVQLKAEITRLRAAMDGHARICLGIGTADATGCRRAEYPPS
jgi:hypothetical protein